ncbi:MAG TPA: tetrahydromethanopterin S-methyltransferase subunit F [Candidatus Acidoferrales bacterium]|jgi:tetrahydromethanopterin S-methyltransferase F subunit|nr:tetrahydromethanopterin S-methyltransferase subunit F [Candidatus Acidoferrales bacterium]
MAAERFGGGAGEPAAAGEEVAPKAAIEFDQGIAKPMAPSMASLDSLMADIKYRALITTRTLKLDSGYGTASILGFALGFAGACLIAGLPLLYYFMR